MMDIQLKERLVGAVVLVLAAVMFIPMVLDGPAAERTISREIMLPGVGDAETRRTVRIDLDPAIDEGQPGSATVSSTDTTDPAEPVAIDLTPVQEEAVASNETPAGPVKSAAGKASTPVPADAPATIGSPWTVQVGSFSEDSNAEGLAANLRNIGYPAYVSRFHDGKRTHYRVRVGGYSSRAEAGKKAAEIAARTGEPARPASNQ